MASNHEAAHEAWKELQDSEAASNLKNPPHRSLKWRLFEPGVLQRPRKSIRKKVVDDKPFRLMDLPPELRIKIYRYATKSKTPLRLRHTSIPPIAKVAFPQLRQEVLTIFFEVNVFVVSLICPIKARRFTPGDRLPAEVQYLASNDNRRKKTGDLNLSQETRDWYDALDVEVCINNVDFVLTDRLGGHVKSPDLLPALLRVRGGDGKRNTTTTHLFVEETSDAERRRDLEHLLAPVETTIKRSIAQEGYKGFSIGGLRRIANTVREVAPRAGREVA